MRSSTLNASHHMFSATSAMSKLVVNYCKTFKLVLLLLCRIIIIQTFNNKQVMLPMLQFPFHTFCQKYQNRLLSFPSRVVYVPPSRTSAEACLSSCWPNAHFWTIYLSVGWKMSWQMTLRKLLKKENVWAWSWAPLNANLSHIVALMSIVTRAEKECLQFMTKRR